MAESTPATAEMLVKYPVPQVTQYPALTVASALAAHVERHDSTESINARQAATEAVREIHRDVGRVQESHIRLAQDHERRRAEVCADARDVVAAMDALASSPDPVTDEVLQALDDYENLSRRMEATADRLITEAGWLAEKIADPLGVLDRMQQKFPTIRKHYV